MARPRTPLHKLYMVPPDEVDFVFTMWPDVLPDTPCWFGGPRHFRHGSRIMSPLRYLALQATGQEVPAGLHFHRRCKTPGCRNLLHYEVK